MEKSEGFILESPIDCRPYDKYFSPTKEWMYVKHEIFKGCPDVLNKNYLSTREYFFKYLFH